MSKPITNKKPQQSQLERRFLPALQSGVFEVRQTSKGKKITGYASKFNVLSEDLGGFRECIDPGAFRANLASKPDVRALFNHDPNLILGRTTAGTLRLSTDAVGLKYEVDPPDTQTARDLVVSMERGDVTQSSFGFICTDDKWEQDAIGGIIRTVLEAELYDVSPVTYPAYLDATSGLRTSLRSCPFDLRAKLSTFGKITRDDDDEDCECEEGQVYDDATESCIDASEIRCQFRCSLHSTGRSKVAGYSEDDQSACQFRCGQCDECRTAHLAITEDDSGARSAHLHLLRLRSR